MAKLTAIKAIRMYCTEQCCSGDLEYARECPSGPSNPVPCPLWHFRMGKNPNISDETKAKARERATLNPIVRKNAKSDVVSP